MNSIWNNNIALFKQRFSPLYNIIKEEIDSFDAENTVSAYSLSIEETKNSQFTIKEKSIYLHSRYNPEREAQNLIKSLDLENKSTVIFMAFGLGYGPVEMSKLYPDKTMILVECDTKRFLLSLYYTDWTSVFKVKNLILLINAPVEDAAGFIHKFNHNEAVTLVQSSQTSHNASYFDQLIDLIKKNNQTDQVNTNTLEKFSYLWMKNSIRNLPYLQKLQGVKRYFNKATSLPFVIIAAGPSLNTILPYIQEIYNRSIIVCVDTALHALLSHGVQPDFVILADPQYYCSMHLEFLESPSSILITESAVYPSVFRFNCKEIILFSSLFPVGQFFESKLGAKGKLATGGSVTTTAWDFARKCGAKEIFIAGMDLGFPHRQTHIKGSQFEEKSLRTSHRTSTIDNASCAALFSTSPQTVKDYNGNSLLSDQRMTVFSWWFKQSCIESLKTNQKTYSLTHESCAIEGISPYKISDFLNRDDITAEKKAFMSIKSEDSVPYDSYIRVLTDFKEDLNQLLTLSKRGLNLCQKALEDRSKSPEVFKNLQSIDYQILNSRTKDAASLVFPTQRQLDELTKDLPEDKVLKNLFYSRIIYTQLSKAIKSYLKLLD